MDSILDQISDGAIPVSRPQPGGSYDEEAKLRSTEQLMEDFGYSKAVIRRAIEDLKQLGVVVGVPGKGVYVVMHPNELEARRSKLDQAAEHAAAALELARYNSKRLQAIEECLRRHPDIDFTPLTGLDNPAQPPAPVQDDKLS